MHYHILHLKVNPDDIANFQRIVNEPKRGIGQKLKNNNRFG